MCIWNVKYLPSRIFKFCKKIKLRLITVVCLFLVCAPITAQNDWNLFAEAEFKDVFVKEFYAFKSLLVPTTEITELEGRELVITGFYIPVATKDNSIILSKTPFASCFFCGSAGQETVIDVRLKKSTSRNYIADDKIKVKGTLKINSEDWETLSFILEDAEIVEAP